MAGGERRETEDARWGGFMRGLRDAKDFAHGAPAMPPPIAPRVTPTLELEVNPKLPKPDHLDQIAELLLSLTYGEMIELAGELWNFREASDLNKDTLPSVWHGWATRMES